MSNITCHKETKATQMMRCATLHELHCSPGRNAEMLQTGRAPRLTAEVALRTTASISSEDANGHRLYAEGWRPSCRTVVEPGAQGSQKKR
jgi:hypothetical protein